MSSPELDQNWSIDLESALIEGCDKIRIREICKYRPFPDRLRAEIWQLCLDDGRPNELDSFNQLFDMKEQDVLRKDCNTLVDKLGNDEEEKVSVASDLETILTCYCKAHSCTYTPDSGWMEILQPMLALRMASSDLLRCFAAIRSRYVTRDGLLTGNAFHLFRLLLLYHDPELCSFMDTKRVTPDLYATKWFLSLFASVCDLKVTLSLWDVYLQYDDPFFVFFLALVVILNTKEQLMTMESSSKQEIIDAVQSIPAALEADDIEDFCSLAQYYVVKTPNSFRQEYASLFGESMAEGLVSDPDQVLCLTVMVEDLIRATSDPQPDAVKFFVVDCRPAEQYNSGHLPIAFHLDANLMLQNPTEFATAVQALKVTKNQGMATGAVAGGEHLCFVGSGREEEDQYAHMVVAHFLQKASHYVSLLRGGYKALHDGLVSSLLDSLVSHNTKTCIECSPEAARASSAHGQDDDQHSASQSDSEQDGIIQRFNKLGSAVKERSAGWKEKVVNYIKNEGPVQERHVNASDTGPLYRGMASVFTIDDEPNNHDSEEDKKEVVNVETWLKKPEVLHTFQCEEVKETGYMYKSHLLVTSRHLYVLREVPHRSNMAWVQSRRALGSIVKITSKKRHPEVITFKYGSYEIGKKDAVVTAADRFLIPRAGEATKAIKLQIIKVLEALENS